LNRSNKPIGPIQTSEPEDALVTRPDLDVVVRHLPPGGAAFVTCLCTDETLGAAATAALADSSHFDLAANIVGMLEAGAFTEARGA
jgi:hypothetical protein